MNLYSKISALGAVLIMASAFAAADTLQLSSYATGNPSGVTGDANSAMNFAGVSATNAISSGTGSTSMLNPTTVWAPAMPNSTWVGVANGGPGGTNPAQGYYTFTTTFAATGFYSGSISVMADDTTEVFLNGVALPGLGTEGTLGSDAHCADGMPNCSVVDTVALYSLNLSGTNTLQFVVQQAGNEAAPDPSGVDFTATLTSVPEPNSLMLLGTGLVGSAGALLRRMRRA